ncbi:antibiotic biosynthesis monooxygenase family protein [Streptomyces jumonjinensis]|uniref:antibiotic biosynthesis monooxygenase family protein n=1 Tax=Streptomyces jumonjinensis TaxID=1945 RepID=UPI0037AD4781
MIRTVLTMKVREGCAEAFERAWRDAARVAGDYPGCLGQTMLRSPEDPLRYTITADWASSESLTAYQLSEDRKSLSATLDRLRESATKSLLDIVAHVSPPTASAPTTKARS